MSSFISSYSAAIIECLVLAVLSMMGASCFAMSALGVALIFQIGYFLAGALQLLQNNESLTQANVYLTALLLPMSIFQSIHLRAHLNLPYVFYFGVVRAGCTAAGISILISNDTIWLLRALGIFLLLSFFIFAYIQYFNSRRSRDQMIALVSYNDEHGSMELAGPQTKKNATSAPLEVELNECSHLKANKEREQGTSFIVDTCKKRLLLVALGVSSGLIRGLWGIAGIPIMFFALLTNIDFNEFRSSTAFAIILSEIVSVIQLYIIENKMDLNAHYMGYIAILGGGALGIIIGNYLAKYHLNQTYFHWFIMYIMLTGGVVLCVKDIWTTLFDIIITAILLFIPLPFAVIWCLRR